MVSDSSFRGSLAREVLEESSLLREELDVDGRGIGMVERLGRKSRAAKGKERVRSTSRPMSTVKRMIEARGDEES